jgi:hypothetical protein
MPELAVRDLSILELAEHAAKSGYFADARQAAQAVIKIQYGRELGIPPVTAIMGVHIIQGKPTPSAGLIAACIRRHPRYDYRVKRLDDTACVLEFFDGGKLAGLSDFTIEQAKRAGAFDSNAATWSKFPRNMLFARALTNGARWFTPDVFGGAVYSPEEMGAVVDEEGDVIDATPAEAFVPLRARDPEPDPGPRSITGKLLMRYGQILTEARHAGAITEAELQDYILPSQAGDPYIIAKGKELADKIKAVSSGGNQPPRSEPGETPTPPAPRRVTVRSVLGQQLANLVEMAAAGGLEFEDCKVEFPADEERVQRAIIKLQDRIQAHEDQIAAEADAEAVA